MWGRSRNQGNVGCVCLLGPLEVKDMQLTEAEAPKAHLPVDPLLRCGWIQAIRTLPLFYFLTFLQGI